MVFKTTAIDHSAISPSFHFIRESQIAGRLDRSKKVGAIFPGAAHLHRNRRYLLFDAKTVTLRTVAFPAPSVHVIVMR